MPDCRQKAILPRRGRIVLSANERITEFLNIAIQAKFAYVNKLKCKSFLKPPRSEEGSLRGLESRARWAGFSVMEIGNRKKRLRFYTSFPD